MGIRPKSAGSRRRVSRVAVASVVGAALTLVLAACGGSDSPSGAAKPPAATPSAKAAAADAGKAVSTFVASLKSGDGAAACAVLTDAEKKLFILGADEIKPKLDTKSCEGVVESFRKGLGGEAKLLAGSLGNVTVTGEFANGDWQWTGGNGQQAVALEKKGDVWLLGQAPNDFPTAALHFFDRE